MKEITSNQNSIWYTCEDVVFVPIPGDPADAYKLYQEDPIFKGAVDYSVTDLRNVDTVLHSGPNVLEVEKHIMGFTE